jgi:hypothetical protein
MISRAAFLVFWSRARSPPRRPALIDGGRQSFVNRQYFNPARDFTQPARVTKRTGKIP